MKRKGFIVPDEVLTATDINNTEKVLLCYLINREFNSGTYEEDITQQEMADRLHTSLVTVSKSILNLEAKGYLNTKRVKYPNNRYRNVYRTNWEKIEENGK